MTLYERFVNILSLTILLLTAIWNIPSIGAVDVSSETLALSNGLIRYHYDVEFDQQCETVLLIGFGTVMTVQDYDILSSDIVQESSIVMTVLDPVPGFFDKTGSLQFARLANTVSQTIHDLVPAYQSTPSHGYIVGGHSAGGRASMLALQTSNSRHSYSFEPVGFLGLDPFPVLSPVERMHLPVLYWGFEETTGLVFKDKAALAAFKATDTNHRVMHQIKNEDSSFIREPSHCLFTDHGCGYSICLVHRDNDWIRGEVADSIKRFVVALSGKKFQRSQFDLELESIKLLFNDEDDFNILEE